MKRHLLILAFSILMLTVSIAAQDAIQNADVLLKSGDVVSVTLSRFHDGNSVANVAYRGLVVVGGKVHISGLGEVQAEGLTVAEFEQILQGRYAKHVGGRSDVSVMRGISPGIPTYPVPPKWRTLVQGRQ